MIILPFLRKLPFAGHTVIPGSAAYTTPGVYYITIPYYNTFVVDVRGASGGGGGLYASGGNGTPSSDGGYSYFNAPTGNLVGYGGTGGGNGDINWGSSGANGSPGSGVNGDYNGVGDATTGGAGAADVNDGVYGGTGGNGARAYKYWYKNGPLTPLSVIQIVVGASGVGGTSTLNSAFNGQPGQNGAVYISWS